jgi:nucleotide-binding universal stress UspA family protein
MGAFLKKTRRIAMTMHARPVDIGCLVRVSDKTPVAAIRQGIALAAASEAHLTILIGVQTFTAPYTPFWTDVASSVARKVNDQAEAQGESIAETARSEARAAGIDADVVLVAGPFAEVSARAGRVARTVDLVIVDQQHGALDTGEMLLEEALFHSGRPVMVASPHRRAIERVKRILVGWDGSPHAVRAVADALSVFPTIETVEVVTVSGEKSLADVLPGADFARHLARKGLNMILTDISAEGRSVAEVLDTQAEVSAADLIVTGAFGHSRLREFLLGGVTVDLSEKARSFVLMAY